MTRDEVIASTFAALDRHVRQASIAEIGGFRPSEMWPTSYFGGQFAAGPGDEWPLNDGEPMVPLLQIRTDELPHRPSALAGIALLNVFVGPRRLPIDLPSENGSGWLLRSYPNLADLTRLALPGESPLRPFPVRWHPSETEGPQWEEAWSLHDLTEFNKLDDAIDLFYDRYTAHTRTKVGGWPSYIQGSPGADGFVFQIDSEEKPNWMWGDNGIGYFYLRDGKWFLFWDCY